MKPPRMCVIFSDSLSSIQSLESGLETSPIHQEIKYCFYQLSCQGISVTISWIPSHVNIVGNEVVDKLAKKALNHDLIDFQIQRDISDLYALLSDRLMKEWQILWDGNKTGRFYHQLEPTVSQNIKYNDTNRAKQTCITRLRFGKCLLGDVLNKIGRKLTNKCDTCDVKEDVKHYLLVCPEYKDYQIDLNDKVISADYVPSIHTFRALEILCGLRRYGNMY